MAMFHFARLAGFPDYILKPFRHGNYGSPDLLKAVERINPRYHLFGHIHAAYGIKKLHQTTFVNSAIMNGIYEFVNKPILLEI